MALDAIMAHGDFAYNDITDAYEAIRAHLAKPEPEPVAWMDTEIGKTTTNLQQANVMRAITAGEVLPLYTKDQL
jgi:hypothetical protein